MTHPTNQSGIDACVQCAQACEQCGEACLREPSVADLVECIRLDTECAILCWTAAPLMSRGSRYAADLCRLCAEACDACAAECDRHSHMEHCRLCAEACRRCAEECRRVAGTGILLAA